MSLIIIYALLFIILNMISLNFLECSWLLLIHINFKFTTVRPHNLVQVCIRRHDCQSDSHKQVGQNFESASLPL